MTYATCTPVIGRPLRALATALILTTALPGCADVSEDAADDAGQSGVTIVSGYEHFLETGEVPDAASTPLFDGSTLTGWRAVPGSEGSFTVEDGELVVSGGPGFLETEAVFADFLLTFEFRTDAPDTNSGVFFRAERGTEQAPSHGYELQLCNTIENGDRTKPADYGDGWGTGAIFRRQRASIVNADDGVWNSVTLIADGPRFRTWVNGVAVCDFTDTREPHPNPRKGLRLDAGHISLQGHDPTTAIRFRNMRISPLEVPTGDGGSPTAD